jgi:predicted transcriptional regulator
MSRAAAHRARELQGELPPPFGRATNDNDVWEACYSAHKWINRREIAARVGRSVTPALIARIERLVNECILARRTYPLPNGTWGYEYCALETGETEQCLQEKAATVTES